LDIWAFSDVVAVVMKNHLMTKTKQKTKKVAKAAMSPLVPKAFLVNAPHRPVRAVSRGEYGDLLAQSVKRAKRKRRMRVVLVLAPLAR
jgi:hypothetical protein